MRNGYGGRWILGAAGALLLILCLSAAGQDSEILKIDGSVQPKKLSRGEEGKVVLDIEIQPEINLSAQPSFIIEFTPVSEIVFPKNFFTASDLNLDVVERNGESFLSLEKPVEIPFTISLEAKPGGHILEGRIKYFARSFKEGWCYKSSSKFSVAFSTRQTFFKKKGAPQN